MSEIKITQTDLEVNYFSKDLVISVINNLINCHKRNYLTEWERNHNMDDSEFRKNIKELEELKAKLIEELKSSEKVSLDVTITNR